MEKRNLIAKIFYIIGWIEILSGFLIGFFLGDGIISFLLWIIIGVISGFLFIAISEIIDILEIKKEYTMKSYHVLSNNNEQLKILNEKFDTLNISSEFQDKSKVDYVVKDNERDPSLEEFLKTSGIFFARIIDTPLMNYFLVELDDHKYKLFHKDKNNSFIEVPKNALPLKLTFWIKDNVFDF